jgi:hypothetical protein
MNRMRFACWITRERIQTHTYNVQCLLLSIATVVTRQRLVIVRTLPFSFCTESIPLDATSCRHF